jgi:hypothetical protein
LLKEDYVNSRVLCIVAVLALAPGASGDEAPPPDCSKYSLEGVRIDMTLDEVRAAHPGAEFSQRGKKDGAASQQTWRVHRKWKKETPGINMYVTLREGRVVHVRNEYWRHVGAMGELVTTVEPAVLLAAFERRFGPELSQSVEREPGPAPFGGTEVYTSHLWSDPACDRMLTVEDGKRITAIDRVVENPVLRAQLSKRSVLVESFDEAVEDGVRF